ncbi:bifunctional precorrin-2 dehydrogenase/sirohydrochlorin ferrochelatase [Thermanaerosceptrum fracticalcis]|uniref:precorrin-2 dehydrogenase n=1 Tax=Thermanaerosceptrum fracticalcis TaxID=1712410 RepID=A0A7G6E1D8_THEFR|nr:bifunctional precorrin-2 dehydrogenase/sirohydrochlorin ferrochelatase [Thermanaerosceptrum fracticalcis]QNB45892.1 bifunctional precorrin-2 dehydrogenase/sirohydrochlorin ferrochelatase [Thermanaerosceptrum fracticalcis]
MSLSYPVNLNISGKGCLVVGGGSVAARKVRGLLECGGKVCVVSPMLHPLLLKLTEEKQIVWLNRNFQAEDINDKFLVIAATDNAELNHEVAALCTEKNILINVVDDPLWCSFTLPAVHRQGDLLIAVSTNGKSPALARVIKEELAEKFRGEFAQALELLGNLRETLFAECPDDKMRGKVLQGLVTGELLKLIEDGQLEVVKERINRCLLSLQD